LLGHIARMAINDPARNTGRICIYFEGLMIPDFSLTGETLGAPIASAGREPEVALRYLSKCK